MLAIVLIVKARGENQYIVAGYSVNSLALLFFFRPVFQNYSFYVENYTHDYTNVAEILTLCHFFQVKSECDAMYQGCLDKYCLR